MRIKNMLISLFLLVNLSCAKTEIVNNVFSPSYRWMDKNIYFAYSNANYPDRNNEFQKAKVRDAIKEISSLSILGENYFNFSETDESLLQPLTEKVTSKEEFKSFILIWPDSDFSDYVVNRLQGTIPDQNAVVVLNAAYKRKFFMIIKASCFLSHPFCNNITSATGLRALMARQFGLMVGIQTKDCDKYANDVMCSDAKDIQWSPTNRDSWIMSFSNSLEAILNNPSFYNEYQPPTSQ